jgi:uncharacterized membrane protein YphA (DoxX/SURF4 family)/thiol-disulfide isomerase/thioredoxin
MILILVLIRIFLSLVFGVAGITKLLDQKGTRESVSSFGLPESLAPSITILLPLAELAVSVGLWFGVTAWAAAGGALLLLFLFTAVVVANLRRGNTPDCHCFGQLYSRPLGRDTILRNSIFAFLAMVLVFQEHGNPGPNAWTVLANVFANQPRTAIAGCIVVVTVITLGWWYLRKKAGEHRHSDASVSNGLPVDSPAPTFELTGFDNAGGSLKHLLAYDKPVMLLFANPKCGPCAAIFQEVGHWQQHHSAQITIAVVSQGTMKDNFVNTARNNLRNVLLQKEREVADLYDAKLTPSAVIVRTNGLIGSQVVAGADEIRALLQSTIGSATDYAR